MVSSHDDETDLQSTLDIGLRFGVRVSQELDGCGHGQVGALVELGRPGVPSIQFVRRLGQRDDQVFHSIQRD